MKKTIGPILTILILAILVSCKKEGAKQATPTLVGRWSVVSDSTFSDLAGVVIINKTAGDPLFFYNFSADGTLSILSRWANLDTASYALKQTNQVYISYHPKVCETCMFGFGEGLFSIATLTDHKVVLKQNLTTTDGPLGEIIILSK